MKAYVGITDRDWFDFLAAQNGLDEVNFWKPGGASSFKALPPGGLFLFKLHAPDNFIVGGGYFGHFSRIPASLAWAAFEEKNGAATFEGMFARIARYRREPLRAGSDPTIGCILLEQPFFFERSDWIPIPPNWKAPTQQGRATTSPKRSAGTFGIRFRYASRRGVS